jgi:hypothetical protein
VPERDSDLYLAGEDGLESGRKRCPNLLSCEAISDDSFELWVLGSAIVIWSKKA